MNEELLTGKILMVEDDRTGVELLADILTSVGHVVEIARDGREALVAINTFEPDLILLDLQMPGRDGFELSKLIRVNPRLMLTPIIMISGLSEPGVRSRARECGADDFISKPLRSEDLVMRIGNGFRLLAMRREMASLRAQVEILKSESRQGLGSLEALHTGIDQAAAGLHRSVLEWASGTGLAAENQGPSISARAEGGVVTGSPGFRDTGESAGLPG